MNGEPLNGEPLPFSPFVVRAEVVRAQTDARAIRAAAENEAANIRAALDVERQNALREARQEGLRQGLREVAALVANAADAVETFWRQREAELAEVALAIAHRVLASLPADDMITRLAIEAIAEHGANVELTIRTAPDAAAILRQALHDLDPRGRITVLADVAAAPGECTLVHPRGRTELGLLAQFRAMMENLPAGLARDAEQRQ
jgi:flagellar biosynthesis/type III secretory pathway protein FliH